MFVVILQLQLYHLPLTLLMSNIPFLFLSFVFPLLKANPSSQRSIIIICRHKLHLCRLSNELLFLNLWSMINDLSRVYLAFVSCVAVVNGSGILTNKLTYSRYATPQKSEARKVNYNTGECVFWSFSIDLNNRSRSSVNVQLVLCGGGLSIAKKLL